MELKVIIPAAITGLVGVMAGYILQKLPLLHTRIWCSIKRLGATLNWLRRFAIARKSTRIRARASFMSHRNKASQALLELTLFRWFEKDVTLVPCVLKVYANHQNELVRSAAAALLWSDQTVNALQPGDIVRRDDNACSHVVHIARDNDRAQVTWDVSHNGTSRSVLPIDHVVKVTRRSWCTAPSCRYCRMGTNLCREIGEWWWSREEARRDVNRLRQGGDFYRVRSVEDARIALQGVGDHESIVKIGERSPEAPEHLDYGPFMAARTVAELRLLAQNGWNFQVTICAEYDHLPPVLVYNWIPPSQSS